MSLIDLDADAEAQNIQYTHGYVAFLDIMGWRNLVEQSVRNAEIMRLLAATAIQVGRKLAITGNGEVVSFIGFTQFSDSIILSADMTSGWEWIPDTFFYWLNILYKSTLCRGLFIRGGLTDGLFYHKGSIAFGPAITRAYDLEEKSTRFMRINVGNEVGYSDYLNSMMREHNPARNRFWDGLKVSQRLHPVFNEGEVTQRQVNLLETVRPHIERNLEAFRQGKPGIYAKYRWFADYFNQVANECGADPIRLRN